jgi:bifunctional non-homologous end joining protein LigD
VKLGRWSRGRSKAVAVAPYAQGGTGLPALIQPQLATLVDRPPKGGDWSYEIKLDGYRVMIRIEGGVATIFTRNGQLDRPYAAACGRLRGAAGRRRVARRRGRRA